MTRREHAFAALEGARIEHVSVERDTVQLELGFRGTDDGRTRVTFECAAVLLEDYDQELGRYRPWRSYRPWRTEP